MTTSGVLDYNLTALQIIDKAFRVIGVGSEGEPLTPRMYEDGLESLNLIMKRLQAAPHLFTKEETTITLVANQAPYLIDPKPMRVLSVRRNLMGIDVPLTEMSRQEYFDQPNKTVSPSIPTMYYFDPQDITGTLYLWPAPSAQTATQYGINLTIARRLDIVTSTNQTIDVPEEWQSAIIYNLADDLETQYPVNDPRLAEKVTQKAQIFLAQVMGWDNETASVFLQPDTQAWPCGN